MNRRLAWGLVAGTVALVGCGAFALMSSRPPPPAPSTPPLPPRKAGDFETAEVIYDGKLAPGWDDWGWGPHELVEGKPAKVSFATYGGIILHHENYPSKFGGVAFRFLAPPAYGDTFLQVSLQYEQVNERILPPVRVEPHHIATLDGGWREVFIPWSALNPSSSPFDRIQIHAHRSVGSEMVSLDKIVLTKGGIMPAAADGPARTVKLAIDCGRNATAISPLIYGVAGDPWVSGASGRRMGGNPVTRLNWDVGNIWNTGADWYFENVQVGKTTVFDWIEDTIAHGLPSALTVPTIGWVAKDATSVGFPVSKLGKQRATDPHRPEAGDGFSPDGKHIRPGPPTETSIPAPPELIGTWITKVREKDAARGKRAVNMYILDNEPNLWNSTHRDVHPEPTTYDELLDRTLRYGTAIRKADPDAVIAGPAEWGWSGYFYSAKDLAGGTLFPHPDQRAHGGTPLLQWYLQKLAQHEKKTGVRILDVLDVHYYPQADNIYAGGGGATDPSASALRIRSTRSLWDPNYYDESWIKDRVNLIPRLKGWIAENYPGRKISIGEWNFGAEKHISGGVATAEVLGRFGEQGVYSAFYWVTPEPGTPPFFAFRTYRDYDGKGARFQDWSIPVEGTADVSLFASKNQAGSIITAVLVNRDAGSAARVELDVSRCGTLGTQRGFFYGERDETLRERPRDPKADPKTVVARLDPYSFGIIELNMSKPLAPQ